MIRVGTRKYNNNYQYHDDPSYEGFTKILCLTASTPYGSLGPYVLKDDKGRIIENIYQGSKIYKSVPSVMIPYSRYDDKIVWKWKAEHHVDDDNNILPAYWKWRNALINNKYAVHYPLGNKKNNAKCLYAIKENIDGSYEYDIDYIGGRKKIYCPSYCDAVKVMDQFIELKEKLDDGKNLLIIEVDGPHQESLNYYKDTYDVGDDFIEDDTLLVNKKNIKIMLNDEKHAFGHGYCLACALFDKDKKWLK